MRRAAWIAAPLACVLAFAGLLLGGGGALIGGQTAQTQCAPPVPAASFGTGAIAWPMTPGSYRLTSGYGPRWGTFHRGIDLAAPIGTPILAAHDGVVTDAGPASGFGLWVVVDGVDPTGQPFSTVYGHNNRNLVTAGQQVSAGQQIAEVGNRGQSTGPHLHFEVWPGGRDVGTSTDPTGWLDANARPGQPGAPAAPSPPPLVIADDTLTGPVPPQGRQATMALTAEQQTNVDTLVGVVKGQGLPLRVAVITVATAMQESSLRVIDYGDLAGPDSRGLFQQRAPWGPYEARMDPVQSTLMFLNGGRGGQRGLLSHNWQGLSLEDVVVDTQISVGGYAKWEAQAMTLVAAAAGVDPLAAGTVIQPLDCGV